MPRTIKSDAQKAHEARNKARKAEAAKRRKEARKAGIAAFKANIKKMKAMGVANKLQRIEAHQQHNAEMAYAAAVERTMRPAANDNTKKLKKSA